jgi:hypothetical protein
VKYITHLGDLCVDMGIILKSNLIKQAVTGFNWLRIECSVELVMNVLFP